MKLTKELIDSLTPEHGRTSCSDSNPDNGFYAIVDEKLADVSIKRTFSPAPRCNRCFLLEQLESTGELDPRVRLTVELKVVQPKYKIEQL